MNIDPQSRMRFGDEAGLRDFFFVHRLVHIELDTAITQAGGGSLPNATLDSTDALDAWVAAMRAGPNGELAPESARALTDWMQLHANLHEAEYQTLHLGDAPDVSQADFRREDDFYNWMEDHASLHDTLNQIVGIS